MNDYIKKADVLKEAELMRPIISFNTDAREAVDAGKIISLPAADVEEVKHGEWIQTFEPLGWQEVECAACSVCGESIILTDSDMDIDDIRNWWNYCPKCGAKMDGKEGV